MCYSVALSGVVSIVWVMVHLPTHRVNGVSAMVWYSWACLLARYLTVGDLSSQEALQAICVSELRDMKVNFIKVKISPVLYLYGVGGYLIILSKIHNDVLQLKKY